MASKMKSKKTGNSSEYEKEGAIVFLDILGFKGIWAKESPDEIFKRIKKIKDNYYMTERLFKMAEKIDEEQGVQDDGMHNPEITFISDTIIIEAEGDDDFVTFILSLSGLIQDTFYEFLKQKLPLRGAISFGKYSRRENIFIGPAVDDVAEWYEKANWMGVILTPKTTILLKSKIHDKEIIEHEGGGFPIKNRLLKYPVPCKNLVDKECKRELYALNWPWYVKTYPEICGGNKNPNTYGMILEMLSEIGNISPSVFDKYENTIRFVKKCLEIEEKQ